MLQPVSYTHLGMLTDHYNPANKTVNLSEGVYGSNSVAAAAVAAHECGHACLLYTSYEGSALGNWELGGVYLPGEAKDHHLDAYIRHDGEEIAHLGGIYPVSYTHLDVYKRQP